MQLLYPILLALLALSNPSLCAKKPKDAILLSSVKTLTLRSNALTSHRRVSAIPQLRCTGPACKYHTVERMRCTNQGASYNEEDIEWSCVADMPEDFKLGSTEVACEGYASRDDPYVLKGSCGVEYRLLFTEKGEEKYGKSGSGWTGGGEAERSKLGGALFMLIFLGVLFWIIYSAWQALPAGGLPRQARRGWGGGWGGGGAGGGDPYDPPPPYPGKRYGAQQEGWRPGFWSGAAAGAAGAYMAGNRGNRQQEQPRGSSWFGGNSGGTGGMFNSPSPPTRSSSGSSSSARHSSTGFGSTSRR
ncbi:hypothetical protein WAI453_001310 [Rhynchosporium graminicola]|uniref:Store-operated calcium entry-associated regulatory factor n=1 Tax=Rhynchosporium graminicola TaxID=2792576 RepID=A0A1E1K7D8_9HELO|nr:related to DUF1183 domain protein [Rhynchosporium commune]